MSLDLIDARFLLPTSPATAVVLGDLPHWRNGLTQAGVAVLEPGEPADLAVMAGSGPGDPAAARCRMRLVEGGARLRGKCYFAAPRAQRPRLLVPVREPRVARYALRRFEGPTRPATATRNALAARAVGLGLIPRRFLVAVDGDPGAPYLLQAAQAVDALPAGADWFLAAGQGDVLSRDAFVVFPVGEDNPTHVVKFARVKEYAEPFERDERGLSLIRRAGGGLARRAPTLIARFNAEGTECSVESAAIGERLYAALQRRSPREARESLVDAVADWLVEVQAATAAGTVEPGRNERLARYWHVDASDLRLPDGVRTVLQHNDPGTWNVVVEGRDFTLLDWEDAEEHGLPLADLWYFLADALAHLDGVASDRRADHFVQLFRGELPSSRMLFAWTARAVERLCLPAGAVGPLATICWLRHGTVDRERRASATEHSSTRLAPIDFGELARRWMSEPGLGPHWNGWAQARM